MTNLTAFPSDIAGGAAASLLGDGLGRRPGGLGSDAAGIPGQTHRLCARTGSTLVCCSLETFELGSGTWYSEINIK